MAQIPDVAPNTPIASSWGNAIRDRTVAVFATTAERDAAITAPKLGQTAYIDATDEVTVWNGVAWRKPWADAWGILAYAEITADQGGFIGAGKDVAGLTFTVTHVANRRIRASTQLALNAVSGGNTLASVFITAGATNANIAQSNGTIPSAGYWLTQSLARIWTPPAGATTYKTRASADAGGVSIGAGLTYPSFLLLEDLGPNGAPA